ncbi:MAG: response regulator [Chloroflexi bacterium]|nr:response regulator [Chloroflexota bacterium]
MPDASTVLIAEDYPDFRARILALIEPLALTCIAVANGREAIDVLRDGSQELHLLITDMDMPVHTGWEVIEAAREHRGEALPIIMQTGEGKYSYVRRRAEELGIVLIDKPDVDALLIPAVRAALDL